MGLRYGSVCSGIEAASVAWKPLGWEAEFFSEIERFPCEVLANHYGSNLPGEDLARNGVPNYGDMTKFQEWPDHAIDLLVGGTPCQSFSVAALRAGLADPRGNLMLTYLAIAARYRPRWLVWENVPGVLSSGDGRDFGTFLQGLGELGYGFAYRVLDAQYVRVGGFEREAGAVVVLVSGRESVVQGEGETVMVEYLKCDAPTCDHVEDVETITADMIGKPCPKCGASLLTAEDWATWSTVFRPAIEAMKDEGMLDPSAPRGAVGSIRVGYHDGQLTMVTPFGKSSNGS